MRVLFLVMIAVLLGCTGRANVQCSPDNCEGCCRNNVCETGTTADACGVEGNTCSTCETGTQLCGEGACLRRCTAHLQCVDPDVCISGACRNPFGRDYALVLESVDIPQLNPTTQERWDPTSTPDGQVMFLVDKVLRSRTPVIRDDPTPAFHQTFQANVTRNTQVELMLVDDDRTESGGAETIEVLRFDDGETFMDYVRQGGLQGEAAVLGGVRWTLHMGPR